jgi:hypothetical protein
MPNAAKLEKLPVSHRHGLRYQFQRYRITNPARGKGRSKTVCFTGSKESSQRNKKPPGGGLEGRTEMIDGQDLIAFSSVCIMVSAFTIFLAVKDLIGYIRVLQSMITDARKVGLRIPDDAD